MLTALLDRLRRRPKAATGKDVLRISYTPSRDGDADPGEVVWTWVPFEDDPRQGKDRPVLVIGHLGHQLAVLPLTSKDHSDRPDCLALGSGTWDPSGRPSFVKLDQLLRVPPAKVRREGASLDRVRFERVVAAFRSYHAA